MTTQAGQTIMAVVSAAGACTVLARQRGARWRPLGLFSRAELRALAAVLTTAADRTAE